MKLVEKWNSNEGDFAERRQRRQQSQTKTLSSLQWRLEMKVLHFLIHFNQMVIFSVEIGSGWSKSYAALCSFFPHQMVTELLLCLTFTFLFLTNILRTVPFLHPLPAQVFFSSLCFTSVWEYKTGKGGCHRVQRTSADVATSFVGEWHLQCLCAVSHRLPQCSRVTLDTETRELAESIRALLFEWDFIVPWTVTSLNIHTNI